MSSTRTHLVERALARGDAPAQVDLWDDLGRLADAVMAGAVVPPARAALPVVCDCVHLGDPLPGLASCGGCRQRLRWCYHFKMPCSVGPSPAAVWCQDEAGAVVCEGYEPKDAPP